MTMTRQHFQLIADVMRDEIETADAMMEEHGAYALRRCAESFADKLATTNPNFDRERFLRACSVQQ